MTDKGIKKGWKVFYVGQNEKHDLFSYTVHNPIKYVKGEWTERPIDAGPLTVFTHKSHAEEFLFSDQKKECLDDIKESYSILPIYYVLSNDNKLWYKRGIASYSVFQTPQSSLPFGTDFADLVFVPKRSLQDPDVINPDICGLY